MPRARPRGAVRVRRRLRPIAPEAPLAAPVVAAPALTRPTSASQVWPDAEVEPRRDAMVVRTAPGTWTNAAAFAVPVTTPGPDGFVFVSARTVSGRAGFSLLAADGVTGISKETLLTADARAVIPLVVPEGHDLVHVLVRNASDVDEASRVELFGTSSRALPVVELQAADVATALRAPAALHADLVGRAWPQLDPAEVPASERAMPVPVRIGVPVPLPLPPLESVFDDEVGRVVLESVADLRAAVARWDDSPVADHIATECRQDMYLQMNTVRVVRLVEALRRRRRGASPAGRGGRVVRELRVAARATRVRGDGRRPVRQLWPRVRDLHRPDAGVRGEGREHDAARRRTTRCTAWVSSTSRSPER